MLKGGGEETPDRGFRRKLLHTASRIAFPDRWFLQRRIGRNELAREKKTRVWARHVKRDLHAETRRVRKSTALNRARDEPS